MFRHPLFLFSTALLFMLGVLHLLGILYSLYYFFRPLDLIAHFLGGAWVSLMVLWFFYFSGFVERRADIRELLFVVFSAVLVLGLAWEVFEIAIGVPLEEGYVFDTLSDLFMDVAGAMVAVFFARWCYGNAEVR